MYKFFSDCRDYKDIEDLEHIIENSENISYNIFVEKIGINEYERINKELGYGECIKYLHDDWSVTFHKSIDKNNNIVYYFCWSAIEFIYKE